MFTREIKGWPKVAWKRKEGPLVVVVGGVLPPCFGRSWDPGMTRGVGGTRGD